jgi:hypothetical protein
LAIETPARRAALGNTDLACSQMLLGPNWKNWSTQQGGGFPIKLGGKSGERFNNVVGHPPTLAAFSRTAADVSITFSTLAYG